MSLKLRACVVERPPAFFTRSVESPRPVEPASTRRVGEDFKVGGPGTIVQRRRT
jgi:hypothetical protein